MYSCKITLNALKYINMTINELREKYLEFFKEKGHVIIPSASLIPENDPSVLFTTAGMHPLVPFLLGEKHPAGDKLADVQKCIRTGDIDEVGDAWHLTFFEMLGNWSLGDYFKEEAIKYSYEFLTDKKWLGLNPNFLAVSVFGGDKDAPKDEEAAEVWKSLGIPEERIAYLDKNENWWPAGGLNPGPQGPDTEMFYWGGESEPPKNFDPDDDNWVEIWNDVFMQYNKTPDGKYEPLKQKNIDTGMGLERTAAILQGKKSVYEIESFVPIIDKIIELVNQKGVSREEILTGNEKQIRIIADHVRAATFILGDPVGIVPSNLDQGYVLRRLIRRAVRYAKMIGIDIKSEVCAPIAEIIIKEYEDTYPELRESKDKILNELNGEENRFEKTLEKGLKKFSKMDEITGKDAFVLFSTYGFPLEMTEELAAEQGIKINKKEFEKEFKKHQELSRTASAGKFKGGLAETSEEAKKLHAATHLLHEALRRVLGPHVEQRGSNITAERLRFDFTHEEKMTDEEKKQVENLVNEQIKKDLPVKCEEMTVDEAKKSGAIGLFDNKYGDKVKVYSIGDFSKEICGGPHVDNISELGEFKIKKEEASSAGIRRIKAILK